LLTRSVEDCAGWAQLLQQHGVQSVLLPCIHAEAIDTPLLRAALAAALASADWLVFTSRRGVEAFVALHTALRAHTHVAAVGEATAAAARELLGRIDLIGRGGTAAGLATTLIADGDLAARGNVLLAVAANAGTTLERELAAVSAHCTRLDVYRTVPAPPLAPKRALSSLGADNVLLASPSAVHGFVRQVAIDTPAAIYTIGPSTTAAARAEGLTVTAEAREPSLEGILEAMQWRN
jgi:uroporphyrinogen-III synthase